MHLFSAIIKLSRQATLLAIGLCALIHSAPAQQYGLDTLTPIGKYLDNKLPSTTPGTPGGAQPPATLSQVGAFSNLATLTPRSGLIPFNVNSPLWTDGASKQRWLALPNNGVADTAAEQITFAETGSWQFPKGSVLVKQFDLPTDERNPAIRRRMETRFLVHGEDGVYYGITYRWRADGSNADLLPDGDSVSVPITTSTGATRSQTWSFPSRADCRTCHNAGAGRVVGMRTPQLNGNFTYPATGRTDNQLRALNHLGIFSPAILESAIAGYSRSVPVADTTAPLEHRVLSYLDANCAHCHYPGNPANQSAGFDTRLATPLAQQNIVNGAVLYDLGIANARIIAPQAPGNSVMLSRLSVNGLHQMPPIGRNTVDSAAVSTLTAWINALPIEPPSTVNRSPVALNDEAGTPLNTPVVISVLANDSDPDNDQLTVSVPTVPSSGVVTALPGNQYRYTPATGFTGTTTFLYTVLDGQGGSASATVTIRVLPPATFNSVAFFDGTSRLTAPTSNGGVAIGVADMNGDGMDDILHLQNGLQLRLEYQKPGGAAFTALNVGSTPTARQWAVSVGDTDNNGYPDILIGGYYDGLKHYRANATGSGYSSTTLNSPSIFSQAISMIDINRDGLLDIFACHDDAECAKWRNTGNGAFVEAANLIDTRTVPASDNSGNYGIVWSDYDNDGDQDLYLSKCRLSASSETDPRRINQLFRNNGNGSFTNVASQAGVAFGEQSWVSDFGDIDNDGDMDLYVGNHGATSYMMKNNGNGTFANITAAAGMNSVTWRVIQSVFRDFNNDGWTDLLLTGEKQELWVNNRNSTFTLASNPFNTAIIESCAVGDLNRDGFTDLYAGYATIYNTPAPGRPDKLFLAQPNGNNFLSLTLRGTTSNATGTGARIELHGPWGIQCRDVRSGEGYGISHSFTQIFGMGNAGAATRLRVRWPSGAIDESLNVLPNRFLTLREGSTAAPGLTSPGNQTTNRGTAVNLALSASDPTGDILTYGATGLPAGLSLNSTSGLITGMVSSSALSNYTTLLTVTDGWSIVSRSITWKINGPGAPGVILSTASSNVTGPYDVAISFTASVSGLSSADFIIGNGNVASLTGSGASYSARINPGTPGQVTVSLPANAAISGGGPGNTASTVLPVNYTQTDNTPPTVILTTPSLTVSGSFTVTATFSESVTGLNSGEFAITNGNASTPSGSGTSYSVVVTPAGYGTTTVQLPAGSVNDPAGNTNTASNTLSVSWPQPNRAPVINNPGTVTSMRGAAANLTLQGSDPDGQTLVWSASGLPPGLTLTTSTGLISGTVSASAASSYVVTIGASDGALSASTSFTWNTTAATTPVNGLRGEYYLGLVPGASAPLLVRTDAQIDFDWGSGSPAPQVPIDDFSVRWTGFLTAPYSETYTFTVPSDNGVRIWINNQLVLDKWLPIDISGWHSFTIPLTGNQTVPVKVEYAEAGGGANITCYWYSNTQPWEAVSSSRLTNAPAVNSPPVLTAQVQQSSLRGRAATLQAVGSDPDSNLLTWSATGLPGGLGISSTTGLIFGTITTTAAASNNVTLSVSDGLLTTSGSFTWLTTAPPPNVAPSLSSPGTQSSMRGSIVTLTPTAFDADGDALTWSASGLPAGLSINSSTGQISGTVFSTAATSSAVSLLVTDAGGLTASASFTWNTTAPPLQGLRAEYFAGMVPGASPALLTRTDPTINFDWGGGSPSALVPADLFSVRWTGFLTAPFSETYTFVVPSDNGVRIWLGGSLVLDKWTPNDISGWHTFTTSLTGGQATSIKIEYAELYGGANLALYWYSSSQPWEIINPNLLTPAFVLGPNSAESAMALIVDTQRLTTGALEGTTLQFTRPSSSAALVALIVEQSEDLKKWRISDLPARIIQYSDGTEDITLSIPIPDDSLTVPQRCFFRVHMVVPDPAP